MAVCFVVEPSALLVIEREEIERCKVTRRVVEKHVFRTGIRPAYLSIGLTGVPFIYRGVELKTRICAEPSRFRYFIPEFSCLDEAERFLCSTPYEIPVEVVEHSIHKLVGDAHRVVRGLAGNGVVRLRFPCGVVQGHSRSSACLSIEGNHLMYPLRRHACIEGFFDDLAQKEVMVWQITMLILLPHGFDCRDHRLGIVVEKATSCSETCDLILFLCFPAHKLFNVRMVRIEDHHLCGAPRGPAGLYCPGRSVRNLQKR